MLKTPDFPTEARIAAGHYLTALLRGYFSHASNADRWMRIGDGTYGGRFTSDVMNWLIPQYQALGWYVFESVDEEQRGHGRTMRKSWTFALVPHPTPPGVKGG